MEAVVVPPYCVGRSNRESLNKICASIEKDLFPSLCSCLNDYHGREYSARFYKIVLGHWFRRYINVITNRLESLRSAIRLFPIAGMTAVMDTNYQLSVQDSETFLWATNDSLWNSMLFLRLVNTNNDINVPIEYVSTKNDLGFSLNNNNSEVSGIDILKKRESILKSWARRVFNNLNKYNKGLIINSYLSRSDEIRLNLILNQFPVFANLDQKDISVKASPELRAQLLNKLKVSSNGHIYNAAASLLFEMIPVAFLEGFSEMYNRSIELYGSRKASFIFTSVDFDTNEKFKIWTAHQCEKGSKYIVGQHGNNYGTHRFMNPSIEELSSDKFLTWGWTDNLPQHLPMHAFFQKKAKNTVYKRHGGLLLIELNGYHKIEIYDAEYEYRLYLNEQFSFVSELQSHIRECLTVRMKGVWKQFGYNEDMLWEKSGLDIKIDYGHRPLQKLKKLSRLVVHSYDSTGILESLAKNEPMIAFWQNGFDHLRDSAIPYYQLLVDAGIVHLSTQSAAEQVNSIWDDVPGWWNSQIVQSARVTFCARYAKTSKTPLRDLKKALLS